MIFVLQQNPISTGSTCAYNELPPIDRDPTIKVSIYLQRSCVHTYRYWELINQKSLKINKQVEKETGPWGEIKDQFICEAYKMPTKKSGFKQLSSPDPCFLASIEYRNRLFQAKDLSKE